MTDKQETKTEPYKSQIITAALAQPTESELVDVLNSVNRLQALLHRFAPFAAGESVEVVTQTQAILRTASDKLNQVRDFQNAQDSQELIEIWGNEGRKIESVSV
jgi:hypothetical protein